MAVDTNDPYFNENCKKAELTVESAYQCFGFAFCSYRGDRNSLPKICQLPSLFNFFFDGFTNFKRYNKSQ